MNSAAPATCSPLGSTEQCEHLTATQWRYLHFGRARLIAATIATTTTTHADINAGIARDGAGRAASELSTDMG